MNFKKWVYIFVIEICLAVICCASINIIVDPFFHYHKPISHLFYELNNERYQNDGILKHFDYDAIITGTSMAENFKTSEFNAIFNANAVKVPFSGGSFKEINDNIATGFRAGHNIKYVVRSLDTYNFLQDKDMMRNDLGNYPVYLYNDNLLDDVKYIINKDAAKISLKIIKNKLRGKNGGITSFDEYANWNDDYKFGAKSVLKDRKEYKQPIKEAKLTDNDKKIIKANVEQNVISLAAKHPKTIFYYFFPLYSAAYWGELYEKGELNKSISVEEYAIELILQQPNIKLFSFSTMADITTDLNNFKDTLHYGEWINSQILVFMKNDVGLLTKENYKEYIENEKILYLNYNYKKLFEQQSIL